MVVVFVSGCYDILHAGHITFFQEAKKLGDWLIVSFASEKVLFHHKQRRPSLPDDHKAALIASIRCVDQVVLGTELDVKGLDFMSHFISLKPDILAVTQDDRYGQEKRELCAKTGAKYIVLDKTLPQTISSDHPVSTSSIIQRIRSPNLVPLRVDFAGGWLDVPKLSRPNSGYIVNCAISPLVSLSDWPFEKSSGLGGSAAWSLLNGKPPIESELDLGVGWQDPAIIMETGLCVWKSGSLPRLEVKTTGDFLKGKMLLYWSGRSHNTPSMTNFARNYDSIEDAGQIGRKAVWSQDLEMLCQAIRKSYQIQLDEGMESIDLDFLPVAPLAYKYCGGGFGGYVLVVFGEKDDRDIVVRKLRCDPGYSKIKTLICIEPFCNLT